MKNLFLRSLLMIATIIFITATNSVAQPLGTFGFFKILSDSSGVTLKSEKILMGNQQIIPMSIMSNMVGINKTDPQCALDVSGVLLADNLKATNLALGVYVVVMADYNGGLFAVPANSFKAYISLVEEGKTDEANALIQPYAERTKLKATPTEDQLILEVKAFPNPCEDVIKITSNMETKKRKVSIFDLDGKKIKDFIYTPNEGVIVNTSGWNPGLYIVKVKSDGFIQTTEIIKK